MTQVIPVSSSGQTQFGTGDGATTVFDLPPQPAADFFGVPTIYLTDVLGNRPLFSTPRTNIITNNIMSGAIPGTPGTDPTGWADEFGSTISGLTKTIVGVGVENSVNYIDIQISGTPGSSGALQLYFPPLYGVAAAGQTWTGSMYCKLAAGSLTNISGMVLCVLTVNSGAYVNNGASAVVPTSAALNTQRFSNTFLVSSPANQVGLFFQFSVTNGQAINVTLRIGMPQLENASAATPPIATSAGAVTITDYSISPLGIVNLSMAPMSGAILLWSGSYLYVPAAAVENLVINTLLSQYANSPTLLQLIENFETYINPAALLNTFYSQVWNVLTAKGFGLDIWGKIVGVTRNIPIAGTLVDLGFKEGTNWEPFGGGTFYTGPPASTTYALSDTAFRTLILVKALSNIAASTAPSYNTLLQNLFAGRGRCYVTDTGKMSILYTFEFTLLPYEISIITGSGAFPRPAAVQANVLSVLPASTFGFKEGQVWQPFGSGVFANESQLIAVA